MTLADRLDGGEEIVVLDVRDASASSPPATSRARSTSPTPSSPSGSPSFRATRPIATVC